MTASSRQVVLALASLVVIGACAPAGAGAGPAADPDLLLGAEITDGQFNSAFEAVQRMRPRWLRTRPNVSLGGDLSRINVYVDNVQRGGVEVLESISPDFIDRIEWIDASTATQRWGTGNSVGAIAVTTRR